MEKNMQIIQYILSKIAGGLITTQLIKAIYLVDYESRKYTGKPISLYKYYRYKNGPYDKQYKKDLKALVISQTIQKQGFISKSGREGFAYKLIQKDIQANLLSPVEIYLLKYIAKKIAEHSSKPIEIILDKAYTTEPMQSTDYLDDLNMDQVNNLMADKREELEDIALSEWEFEQGKFVHLEDAWNNV